MTIEESIITLKVAEENLSCDECLYYNQMEDCPNDEDCIVAKALDMAIASMKALKEFKERLEVLEYQHIEGYKLPLYKNEEVWAILEDVAKDLFEDFKEEDFGDE